MVAKDKDEEEEEEEPVWITKFEKEFLFGVKVEKNRIGYGIWNRLLASWKHLNQYYFIYLLVLTSQ